MRPVRDQPIRLSADRPMRGPCFCSGPQPGHELCPCMERAESDKDRRIRLLEAEVRRLGRSVRVQDLMTMRFR